MNLLVTGGAGFIGSNFVRLALNRLPQARIVVLDALCYSGNLSTLQDVWDDPRFRFYPGKIQDPTVVNGLIESEKITHIVNFAAESHNDRSLLDAASFIETNVMGVHVLLEATRRHKLEKIVHVSTDEVYGTISEGQFTEQSPLEPNTPYSAAKAGGDLLCRAHWVTFKTPVVVTHGGNTYGPYHFPEKLIPFFVTRLIDGKKVPLYGEGNQVREWIHAHDHANGVLTALQKGDPGQVYNIGDDNERENREVVAMLLDELGRNDSYVKRIPDPRKGAHDQRYSMATEKMRGLGWKPEKPFEQSLRETVRWYRDNEWWWRPITKTDDYISFITRFYGPSLGEDL